MNPEKKLRLILASLKDREILKYFEVFVSHFSNQFRKVIRQITFNCFEATCEFKSKTATGYGKNAQESFVNGVRTLVELLADESKYHPILRESLKIVQQQQQPCPSAANANCESQKKLSSFERVNQSSMKNVLLHSSIKPTEKKTATLKEEIFEYLNRNPVDTAVDNLKISNPKALKPNDSPPQSHHHPEEQQSALSEVLRQNQ
jgi:hypothetical protein